MVAGRIAAPPTDARRLPQVSCSAPVVGNNPRQIISVVLEEQLTTLASMSESAKEVLQLYTGGTINHQVVAFKRLIPTEDKNADYDSEVGVLSRLSHPKIIDLIGCCARGAKRIIVYEFMPLGTLYAKLHGKW